MKSPSEKEQKENLRRILADFDLRAAAVERAAQEIIQEARNATREAIPKRFQSHDDLQWDYDTCGSRKNSEWGE
jgi:hypothetical protein